MRFRTYSHRFADAIIEHDEQLNRRYNEFVGALASIKEEMHICGAIVILSR